MKTIPEIPPVFELPDHFRASLPDEVQQWLASVERRIDGLTLARIESEADKLAGEDSPEADKIYQLGRRAFYGRMQQIVDLMCPGQGIEVGVDLIWGQTTNVLPGFAVTDAVMDGDNLNVVCVGEEAGVD